jgi:hypothetical protein
MGGASTAARSWSTHIAGLVRLIKLRRPECYAQPGYHEAFMEARYNAVSMLRIRWALTDPSVAGCRTSCP